jgi:hypothetical protein
MNTATGAFHLRTPCRSPAGYVIGYTYARVDVPTPDAGRIPMAEVPAVGDYVGLGGGKGTFVVVKRAWFFAEYGSSNWRAGTTEPKVGPRVDLIVEAVPGIFSDEVELPDVDEDE